MTWKIGDVTPHKILDLVGGRAGTRALLPDATSEEIVKLPWLVPSYAEPNGDLKLTVHSWLVRTPELNILVDTGAGNGKLNRSRRSGQACARRRCVQNDLTPPRAEEHGTFPDVRNGTTTVIGIGVRKRGEYGVRLGTTKV
jgi:hypothetical protein